MIFDDCEELGNSSIDMWKNITETFVSAEVKRHALEREIISFDLKIVFRKQVVPNGTISTTQNGTPPGPPPPPPGQRSLEEQRSPLAVFFDFQIQLRSPVTHHPYEAYFRESLDTKEKSYNYINQLQSSGVKVFNSINDVKILLDGKDISQASKIMEPLDTKKSSVIGITVSIAAGLIIAFVTIIGFAIFRRKRIDKPIDVCDNGDKNEDTVEGEVYVVVDRRNEEDVSTLGIPMGNWKSQSEKFEDPTVGESTIRCDYEYQKNLSTVETAGTQCNNISLESSSLNISSDDKANGDSLSDKENENKSTPPASPYRSSVQQQSLALSTVPENAADAISCEEESFDKEFESIENIVEINAPPGKLGIIIEASGGHLVVDSIKFDSPLINLVRVGDILVSVDEEAVAGLPADEVSRMISSLAGNPNRLLTFIQKQ